MGAMESKGQGPGKTGFAPQPGKELAAFGAGCFWGVEKAFARKFKGKGVEMMVGYCGGTLESPSYRQVCNGFTGHAEAVQVRYDPNAVTFKELTDFFFRMHDPTTKNRQGNDMGSQYRSAVFYTTDAQKETAEQVLQRSQTYFGRAKIQTTIEPMGEFWKAEDYHQDYLTANPHGYECPTHFERSWEKIENMYKKR
ncbi:Peptide-methionine (S)-S-oxide reductase [Phlyctochytrium bullatum]|nr:Peptide-methionine (S)-S-oxide reductase [Phlyctochytrium bullatum]